MSGPLDEPLAARDAQKKLGQFDPSPVRDRVKHVSFSGTTKTAMLDHLTELSKTMMGTIIDRLQYFILIILDSYYLSFLWQS